MRKILFIIISILILFTSCELDSLINKQVRDEIRAGRTFTIFGKVGNSGATKIHVERVISNAPPTKIIYRGVVENGSYEIKNVTKGNYKIIINESEEYKDNLQIFMNYEENLK